MKKKIFIFILGNNQAGGAQYSFLKEAQALSSKTKHKTYFFLAGKAQNQNFNLINNIKSDEINFISSSQILKANIFSIFRYAIFIYKQLRSIKSANKDSKLICSHTTPLASFLATSICLILGIKDTRYRIGGLLYQRNLPFYIRLPGFILEYYLLYFNSFTSFVCQENKNSYILTFPKLLKNTGRIDVFYSICKIDHVYNKKTFLNKKFNVLYNKKLLNLPLNKIVNGREIILTVVNDKKRKGSNLFYKLAENAKKYESILFVHLGTRKFLNMELINDNLLVVPHTSNNIVADWLNICKFTVLLSTYPEGLPQVLPQSLSFGKPIFCFENTGIQDSVIHGFNGIVISRELAIDKILEKLLNFAKNESYKEIFKNTLLNKDFYKNRHSKKKYIVDFLNSNFYKNV